MISTTLPVAGLCKKQVIALGRQMEDNYRQIIFDVSDFTEPITSIMLVHQRKGDVAPYIVDTVSGDQFVWTITKPITDTARERSESTLTTVSPRAMSSQRWLSSRSRVTL